MTGPHPHDPFPAGFRPLHVLIAGGGIAGLEAALALRELAADRVAVTLLTPEAVFSYRPLSVLDPFPGEGGRRYDLERIAHDAGAELYHDRLAAVDSERAVVHTAGGAELHYDALLVSYGAEVRPRFAHARTVEDGLLIARLRGLVQDVEEGYVRSLAFVAAGPPAWPLPLYELALMTSRAAYDMCAHVSATIVTPERTPLEVFGDAASRSVQALLDHHGVQMITAAQCEVPAPGHVVLGAGRPPLEVESVVAMPQLRPRPVPGIPLSPAGFIAIDDRCRIRGLSNVYAAGDATDFPVKHGSIAAQQADTAAAAIARSAGADVPDTPFEPVLQAMLLGGERPLYLRARLDGDRPVDSEASQRPLWRPDDKIAARHLGPYLHHADQLTGSFSAAALR